MVWPLGQQKQRPHEGQGRNPGGAGALPQRPLFLPGPPQTSAMWAAAGQRDNHAQVAQQPSWAPERSPRPAGPVPSPTHEGSTPQPRVLGWHLLREAPSTSEAQGT